MLEVIHIEKTLGTKKILDDISLTIDGPLIYGLIGYNGVGKTTLLKIINGIYRPEQGQVRIDSEPVFENVSLKRQMFLMTEELYFPSQARYSEIESFYRGYYPSWNHEVFRRLTSLFQLPEKKRIREYSKGMLRQTALIIAFASGVQYLFLDEAFDGLDLAVRKKMRKILRLYMEKKQAIIILTSHNLSELEICVDRFGMIRNGKLICDKPVEEILQTDMSLEEYFLKDQKEEEYDWETLFEK